MFHQSVSRFGLATHLALAAALPAALSQFVSTHSLAVSMMWMTLAAWIWILFEPSVFAGETISRARSRMIKGLVRDPMAWFLLLSSLFAMSRWLNSGLKLFYDAEKTVWTVQSPTVAVLPASVEEAGLLPFVTVVVAATVILGVKHALGRNARIWFGVMTGSFAAIGGLAASICVALGVEMFKESALATFGAPFFAGTSFALILPMAIACGIEAEEHGITKARLLFAFAVAGNAVAVFVFLPIILSLAYLAVSVVVAAIALVLCKRQQGAAACARAASMLALGIVAASSVVLVPSCKDMALEKISGLNVEKAFPSALSDRNEALQRVSVAMWKDFRWGGVGVGAFKLQAPFYVSAEDWSVLPPRPELSSNSYLTMMSERGIIGSLFWLTGIVFLVLFWVMRLIGSLKWHEEQEEGRAWVFCLPATVWAGLCVLSLALVDAWFSSGFHLTPLAVCAASAMSLAASSFPKMRKSRENNS